MKFTKLALAAALAAAFAVPAVAGTVTGVTASLIANGTVIGNAIGVAGTVEVDGDINVLSESGAVLDTEQFSNVTVAPATPPATPPSTPTATGSDGGQIPPPAGDPNTASVSGTAGSNAQGNIAINAVAGHGNGQSNAVALSAVDAQRVFASAQTFAEQRSNNTVTTAPIQVNDAFVVDALSNASGNVSVNVAAGDGNLQQNQLAASVNSEGTLAKATGSNLQDIKGTVTLGAAGINTASLGGAALSGAQGNIGANVAAGVSNVQHNSLSIATASAR